jgi:hypothetical protein
MNQDRTVMTRTLAYAPHLVMAYCHGKFGRLSPFKTEDRKQYRVIHYAEIIFATAKMRE